MTVMPLKRQQSQQAKTAGKMGVIISINLVIR